MALKNILADTNFTKGTDNRFKNAVIIGRVSEIVVNEKGANIRVLQPDKCDHQGQPLISKPIPVMQISAGGKRSFAMPRLGQNVMAVKLPNGTSDYMAVGFFYTKNDPPPVTDPKLDYCIYDDGSTKQFDAESGTETNKFKGDTVWDHEGKGDLQFQGDVTVKSQGTVLIDAPNIHLKGAMNFEGNISHTGNMTTSGIHNAADGPHAACGAGERLEQANIAQRIEALERRIAELEARHGS